MKKVFKLKNFLSLFLLVMVLPITVFAKEKITLEVDKTDLEIGDTITVSAKLPEDIKLFALTATLSFDENVFTKISEEDFILDNDSLSVLYNTENNKFGIINKSGEISNELFKVHLQVKEDATVGTTNIGLTNISSSDGDKKIEFAKESLELLVTRDAKDGEAIPNNKPYEVEEDSNKELKTFATKPLIIGFSVLVSLFLVIAIYFTITKKDHKKLIIILASITGVLLVTLITFIVILNNKKDINKDGHKTYEDAQKIMEYILDIEGTENQPEDNKNNVNNNHNNSSNNNNNSNNGTANNSNNKKPNNNFDYDVNNDGKVDIEDVGSSAGDTTENVNYKVKLSARNKNDFYISKGEVTLEFDAEVTNNELIKEINLDNEWYPVIKTNNFYSVIVTTPNESGVHEFKITKVKLVNNREVSAKLTIQKEILKDTPYVDLFNVDDEKDILSFRLEDKDKAFISGNILVTAPDGSEIINEKVEEENQFSYKFEKDLSYNIVITATYDLDTNKFNDITGEQNLYQEKIIYHHTFILENDYDFKLSNVMITDAISKGEELIISFDSTNNNGHDVEYIVVNGKEYNVVEKKDNHYKVALTGYDTNEFGRYSLDIEKVVLSNLKEFDRNKDYELNSLTYTILKHEPKIDNIKLTADKNNQNIKVSYELSDPDQTIKDLNVVLTDSTDKVIDKMENVDNQNISLSYKNTVDGRYTVKFLANIDLGTERHIYTDKNIGEKDILTQTDISITNVKVTSVYPVKNQEKFTITYQVTATDAIKKINDKLKYTTVSAVTINGLNYDAVSTKNAFESSVSFTVPKEAGVVSLVATRVQLQYEDYNNNYRNYFSVAPYETQIDVLKDKPQIKNIRITDEDYEKGNVTFKFDVVEDKGGFLTGQVKLDDKSKPIVVNENEVTFENVKKDTNLKLQFFADYDLDSNTLENEDIEQNRHYNQEIYTMDYKLIDKKIYDNIKLTDITLNKNYYEKHEDISLNFNMIGIDPELHLEIAKLIYKDEIYNVSKTENGYNATINGFTSAGIKDITIKEIILNNGKKISLSTPIELTTEILKTPISLADFKYTINNDNIKVKIALKDNDHSVNLIENDVKILIYNEDNELIKELPYQEEFTIERDNNELRYYLKVVTNYDRDITLEGDNYYHGITILDEVISLAKNYIELKDVTDVTLYKEKDNKVNIMDNISITDIQNNLKDYYIEIAFSNMPTIRSKLKKVVLEDNHLFLVLESKYISKDSEDGVRIDFGKVEGDTVYNEARPDNFATLINKISNDPDGTFTLKTDLDASIANNEELATYISEFKGTLNGNGYAIKNLNKPLFDKIDGATISNLKIQNTNLVKKDAHGVLANTIKGSEIHDLLIEIVTKKDSDSVFGVVGGSIENTTIERVKASGFTIGIAGYNQQIGGIAGNLANSTIKNCYATGTFSGGWNFRGGIVGKVNSVSTIENCYTKVAIINAVDGDLACGIACGGEGKFINNISLNTGNIKNKIASGYKESVNNYFLGNASDISENISGVTAISDNEVNKALFKDRANFSEDLWTFKNVSLDNLPTLNNEKVNKIDVSQVEDIYDPEKEILYNNLTLLMPFYDSEKIVKSGANIAKDDILNREEIYHIVPVSADGNVVTYLTTDNPGKIVKIHVIFKNGEKRRYDVRYENTFDMVASYRIGHLKVDYTFNHYLINSNSQLVNNLTNYLASLKYEDNLDILTPTADSRIYREFYNDVTRNELKEFVLKYLSNSNYTNTSSDIVINDYLERELKKDQRLEKVLYVYNYFRRFYAVSIDGIMLNDLILFNSQGFSSDLTPDGIAEKYLSNEANFNTGGTNDAYSRTLASYTNLNNIPRLLEYYVTKLTSQNVADWYANEYKGLLREISVEGRKDILYRLWDHISYEDQYGRREWFNYALPILTLPEKSSYIISTPTQFLIGSLRTYVKDPFDQTLMNDLIEKKLNPYLEKMQRYFNTAASILVDSKYFNEIHGIQIDKRFTYDMNGNYMFQTPYVTQEPFHKNFNEVVGVWAHADGNAATSNGTFIFWRAYAALDSDWTYGTWSHETAHNVDARLFLKNNGRRYDAGGEDYADGNLTQRFYEGDIIMNLSFNFEEGKNIGSNLAPERINSPEKVQDFYSKLFETLYIMDYIEGKAFLSLTPKEQSKLAVEASYPNIDNENQHLKYKNTLYQQLDEKAFTEMHLTSIADLYDKHLVIYPGIIYSTISDNRYGGENILKSRWYQPHNDYGRPDSYSLKWFAYEMLGYKGYDDGYIEYYSNIHATNGVKTDLSALQYILKDNNATFRSYKLGRFHEVAQNLQYVQNINVDEVYDRFVEALKADALYVEQEEERAMKLYPNNDTNSVNERNKIITAAKAYKNRESVRKDIYYTMKNNTKDFLGAVYDKSTSQTITKFSTND